jgi:hypothetical protein
MEAMAKQHEEREREQEQHKEAEGGSKGEREKERERKRAAQIGPKRKTSSSQVLVYSRLSFFLSFFIYFRMTSLVYADN